MYYFRIRLRKFLDRALRLLVLMNTKIVQITKNSLLEILPVCRTLWPYVLLPFVAFFIVCRFTLCRLSLWHLTLGRLTLRRWIKSWTKGLKKSNKGAKNVMRRCGRRLSENTEVSFLFRVLAHPYLASIISILRWFGFKHNHSLRNPCSDLYFRV